MTRVSELIESGFVKNKLRSYMGCSVIGEECPRKLWYKFRWYSNQKITPQQKRLFSRGHKEEKIIIKDLKKIGIKVLSTQKGATTAQGHISGHNDGILLNVPDSPKEKFLFEGKTANEKSFTRLKGIRDEQKIIKWNITYFVQAQTYMHLFKIKKCLFIVVSKNTDERYYEIINYDKMLTKAYLERGVDIINSPVPPNKISIADSYFYCKYFCTDINEICHREKKPLKTCRSCKNSEPVKKGQWFCWSKKKVVDYKKQLKACKKYSVIKED